MLTEPGQVRIKRIEGFAKLGLGRGQILVVVKVRKSQFGLSRIMYLSVLSACSKWLPVNGPVPVVYQAQPPAASAPGR